MKNLISIILVVAALLCSYQGRTQSLTMDIVPRIDIKKEEALLEFNLTYEGNESISVDISNLLGKRIRSISFKADRIRNFNNKPFINCPIPEQKIFIDDPGIGYVLIKPGETVTQKIDLYQIFYKFDQIIGKCDFVFYWNYKLDITKSYQAPRIGGAVIIPANLDIKKLNSIKVDLTKVD